MEKVYLLMDYIIIDEEYSEDVWYHTTVLGVFSTFDKANDTLKNSPATDLLKGHYMYIEEYALVESALVESDEIKETEFCGKKEMHRFINHGDGWTNCMDEIYIEEISLDKLKRS